MAIGDITSPKVSESAVARRFLSQGGSGYVALGIFDGQAPVDADADSVGLKVYYNDGTATPPGTLIFQLAPGDTAIVRADVGKYHYDIGPEHTAQRGNLTVVWSYVVGGKDFTYTDNIQILEAMPLYDRLSSTERQIVESVSFMFADLFDSTEGGPYLFETYQSKFNYERIAQLMRVAVARLNTIGNPPTEFEVGGEPGKYTPIASSLVGTLMIGTYIEVLRHLIRSYTEIPVFQQANVTFADRRDYTQRWQQILEDEKAGYKSMVIQGKRKLLGLGSTAILVGGGIFSGGGAGFIPGMQTSMQRGGRFYPAAPALYGQLARAR